MTHKEILKEGRNDFLHNFFRNPFRLHYTSNFNLLRNKTLSLCFEVYLTLRRKLPWCKFSLVIEGNRLMMSFSAGFLRDLALFQVEHLRKRGERSGCCCDLGVSLTHWAMRLLYLCVCEWEVLRVWDCSWWVSLLWVCWLCTFRPCVLGPCSLRKLPCDYK